MSVCFMENWTGHVNIKNCQSVCNQHFGWFHGRVEVYQQIFYPVQIDKNQKLVSLCKGGSIFNFFLKSTRAQMQKLCTYANKKTLKYICSR